MQTDETGADSHHQHGVSCFSRTKLLFLEWISLFYGTEIDEEVVAALNNDEFDVDKVCNDVECYDFHQKFPLIAVQCNVSITLQFHSNFHFSRLLCALVCDFHDVHIALCIIPFDSLLAYVFFQLCEIFCEPAGDEACYTVITARFLVDGPLPIDFRPLTRFSFEIDFISAFLSFSHQFISISL